MKFKPSTPVGSSHRSFSRGGAWQTLFVFALVVFLLPVAKPLFPLLLLLLLGLAFYGFVWGAFYFGRRTGVIAVLMLLVFVVYFFAVQFKAYKNRAAFDASLSQFDTVTVRPQNSIGATQIDQVSLSRMVSDSDLESLVEMPQLTHVSHVYLEECEITDLGLKKLDRWRKLTYIHIESDLISDPAIAKFRYRHPDVSVIQPAKDPK